MRMEFNLNTPNRNVPDDTLIEDAVRVAREISKSPTYDEYCKNGNFHASTLSRRFGGWSATLQKAGLALTRTPPNIPEVELFSNIEHVWRTLGRQPLYREMAKPLSRFSAGTYDKRFGSYVNALEAFVAFIEDGDADVAVEQVPPETRDRTNSRTHVTSRNINLRTRFKVLQRDDFKCQACGASPATESGTKLQIDHIVPWSRGGESTIENLQTLCWRCNQGKGNI